MTDRRILFFSCEAGGAEVLAPLAGLLTARPGFHATVACYGHAQDRFARRGLNTMATQPVERNDPFLLQLVEPDLLITSAASLPSEDMSEKFLWRHALRQGIPSLAFLDQWQNYGARFSGCNETEYLAYQPDYINCINQLGFEEMKAAGFASDRLLMLGHPYLDTLAADTAAMDADAIRTRLGIGRAGEVALFVSEPISEYCGLVRGYDQYAVLDDFLSHYDRQPMPPVILLKLHPKDPRDRYRELIDRYRRVDTHLLDQAFTPLECILAADRVFGMSSIMLLEAFILGKPVVSLQPGLCIDDPCVLSKYGYIRRLDNPSQLDRDTQAVPARIDFDYAFDGNAFLSLVEKMTRDAATPGQLPHPESCPDAI
jgi:hypothetical protein